MPKLNGLELASDRTEWTVWPVLVHSARTAIAAVASVLTAQLFWLLEACWALIGDLGANAVMAG